MQDEDKYWDGPEPTLPERQKNWQFILEYLKRWPDSNLGKDYPYLLQIAMASRRYDEINLQKWLGKMSEEDYQIELEKILPLINVDPDELK